MRRRTHFAAPFVLVIAAGCPGPTYRNPPPPRQIPVEECRAITEGAACKGMRDADGADAHYCSIEATDTKCGLQGYECRATEANAYAWKAVTMTEGCPATPTEPAAAPTGTSG